MSRRLPLAAALALAPALAFGHMAAFAQVSTVPVTIDPKCGPAGDDSSIAAVVTGLAPGSTLTWRYPGANNQAITGSVVADVNGRATFTFTSSGGRQPGTAVLEVNGLDPRRGAAQGFAGFVIPCDPITTSSSTSSSSSSTSTTRTTVVSPGPGLMTLACEPPLGPPGFVTTAVGAGFPPNSPVTLSWRPGIGRTTVVTDASGAIRAPMLIMHHDTLGLRDLVAAVGGSLLGAAPAPTTAPFLVVPATLGPPRALDPRLVFRQ